MPMHALFFAGHAVTSIELCSKHTVMLKLCICVVKLETFLLRALLQDIVSMHIRIYVP